MKHTLKLWIALLAIFVAMGSTGANASTWFYDDFNSTELDPAWTIVSETSDHWSLTASPGNLQIISQPGEVHMNTLRNLFVITPPTDYTRLETMVTYSPSAQYHQAGIMVVVDQTHYVAVQRVYNMQIGNGDGVVFYFRDDNYVNYFFIPLASDTVYLSLDRTDNFFTGSYSTDGTNFTVIGTDEDITGLLETGQVGIAAYNGNTTISEIAADFDYFLIEDSVIDVALDIKPGSYPNSININCHGIIPVAILGSSDFDVYNIKLDSLLFNGSEVGW